MVEQANGSEIFVLTQPDNSVLGSPYPATLTAGLRHFLDLYTFVWFCSSLTPYLRCVRLLNIGTHPSPRYQLYVNAVNSAVYKRYSTLKTFTSPGAAVNTALPAPGCLIETHPFNT